MNSRAVRIVAIATALFILGCAHYKPLREATFPLYFGMSEEEARSKLSEPNRTVRTISKSGTEDRWIYKVHDDKGKIKDLVLYFEDGQLQRWEY